MSGPQEQAETIDLDEVEASARTGDILLFEGRRPELRLMQKVQRSRWSHVGMLIRIPETGELVVWESEPMGSVENVLTEERKSGPQGVPFRSRVLSSLEEGVQAAFGYRRLEPPLTDEHHDRLRKFALSVYDLPFPKMPVFLHELFLGRLKIQPKKIKHFFCSQLVAQTYIVLGLLPDDVPINDAWPGHFDDGNLADQHLREGIRLSPVREVRIPTE